jgi:hypothetical protein
MMGHTEPIIALQLVGWVSGDPRFDATRIDFPKEDKEDKKS